MRSSDKANNEFKKLWQNDFTNDVKLDDHDAIVKWLYRKLKNDDSFVCGLFPNHKLDGVLDKKVAIECPIASISNYKIIVGFIDVCMSVSFKIKLSDEQIADNIKADNHWNAWRAGNRYSSCYNYDGITHRDRKDYLLKFEVKSKVNIGDTIRQINYYKSNDSDRDSLWYVCAPAFDDSDILIDQRVGFVKYEP